MAVLLGGGGRGGVRVYVGVGVFEGVNVSVGVRVGVGVLVGVLVGVGVLDGVNVAVGVWDGVNEAGIMPTLNSRSSRCGSGNRATTAAAVPIRANNKPRRTGIVQFRCFSP